jgi:glycosyltransferase involved in cell wall biosynthesis
MTRSGCLDLNPESRGFGFLISKKSPQDWSEKINLLARKKNLVAELGAKSRKIAEEEFSENRFDAELWTFFNNLLHKTG